jgi:sugar (pentulose or hexulose) kinase
MDAAGKTQAFALVPLPMPTRQGACVEQDPESWWQAVAKVVALVWTQVQPVQVRAIAVDATSGTLLLADAEGQPLGRALMYNDARAADEADRIARLAPTHSAAHGRTSPLAKLLYLQARDAQGRAHYALSQADWVLGRLSGQFGVTDANNAIKLGYDPMTRTWPDWLGPLGVRTALLPQVVSPSTRLTRVGLEAQRVLGLDPGTLLVAGTTDSTASFLATGAALPGEAVTALGSTLVMKVISEYPLFAPQYGVYSQPLGDGWLVGGGSNSGGAVLRHYFTDPQLAALTPMLRPDQPTGLDYYPLLTPGERFPLNDPELPPRLEPRPHDDLTFFQGLLEGMARIEHRAYRLLARLGAPYPLSVYSTGGGARNPAWTAIRERLLQVPVQVAREQEAAYGTALLAYRGAAQGSG